MGELVSNKKSNRQKTSVKIIGVGSGGIRVVDKMLTLGWYDLEYITVSTEKHTELTEQSQGIADNLQSAALAFIVIEPGYSIDAYTAVYVAYCANKLGIKTITAFVCPAEYSAENFTDDVAEHIDSLMCVSHTVIKPYGSTDTIHNLAELCIEDELVCRYIRGIADMALLTGPIPFEMTDLEYMRSPINSALVGVGKGSGENATTKATNAAVKLMMQNADKLYIHGALLGVIGSEDTLSMKAISAASNILDTAAGHEVCTIVSALTDNSSNDNVRVVIIAA